MYQLPHGPLDSLVSNDSYVFMGRAIQRGGIHEEISSSHIFYIILQNFKLTMVIINLSEIKIVIHGSLLHVKVHC